MVLASILDSNLRQLLEVDRFSDYCPNGLQVEGDRPISKLVTGVTASQALVDAAVNEGADAILVHHGYFWKGESAPIVGIKRKRIAALINNGIHLFAYHLPLDAHPVYGNNIQLCIALGAEPYARFGDQNIGFLAKLPEPTALSAFKAMVESAVNRSVFVAGPEDKTVQNIAVCSGGGQSFYEDAIAANADVFLSGEISEHNTHTAVETGVVYMAAGHHATERFGPRALGEYLAAQYNLNVNYIDIDTKA